MNETEYKTELGFFKMISVILSVGLFAFILVASYHITENTIPKKDLVFSGHGYYTNDIFGKSVFKLKNIK